MFRFEILASLYIHSDVCGEAVIYVSVGPESVSIVAEDPAGFRRLGPYICEDGRP